MNPLLGNAPIIDDLTQGSAFITSLNNTESKYKCSIKFYTFTGTNFILFFPFLDPIPSPINPSTNVHSFGEIMNQAHTQYYGQKKYSMINRVFSYDHKIQIYITFLDIKSIHKY